MAGGKEGVTARSLVAARKRLQQLPQHLAKCRQEVRAYAKCVEANMASMQKDACAAEFAKMASCVKTAAKK